MNLSSTATLHNGVGMPWVGLGVYKVDSGAEGAEIVQTALNVGYRSIDTASFYDNEESVGQALKATNVPREELFVTTKVWNNEQGYEETLAAFDRSMEKLGLDYLDLYLIHWPVPGKFKDTWKALEKLYKDGRVKAIGVSNFEPHHLEELLEVAEITPMVNQIEMHPQLNQKHIRYYCAQHTIQVVAWSPIGRGRFFENETIQRLAKAYDKSPAQVILRWEYQHGVITIPKSAKEHRQKENGDVFDFSLTQEEMNEIDSLHTGERIGAHPDEFDYESTM